MEGDSLLVYIPMIHHRGAGDVRVEQGKYSFLLEGSGFFGLGFFIIIIVMLRIPAAHGCIALGV